MCRMNFRKFSNTVPSRPSVSVQGKSVFSVLEYWILNFLNFEQWFFTMYHPFKWIPPSECSNSSSAFVQAASCKLRVVSWLRRREGVKPTSVPCLPCFCGEPPYWPGPPGAPGARRSASGGAVLWAPWRPSVWKILQKRIKWASWLP